MDFRIQLILALIASLIVAYPVYFIMLRKYKREGRSIKYLIYKVCIIVMTPILSIPVLLSDVFSPFDKTIVIILGIAGGVIYLYSVTSARKSFRKILGLPPEDEHTGEVIKEDKKEK